MQLGAGPGQIAEGWSQSCTWSPGAFLPEQFSVLPESFFPYLLGTADAKGSVALRAELVLLTLESHLRL